MDTGPRRSQAGRAFFHKGEEISPMEAAQPILPRATIIHGPDVINESQEFGS